MFALGGPLSNVVAAFAGLFAMAVAKFDSSIPQALWFATTHLWTGLQQQIAGLSALVTNVEQVSGIVGIVVVGGAQSAGFWPSPALQAERAAVVGCAGHAVQPSSARRPSGQGVASGGAVWSSPRARETSDDEEAPKSGWGVLVQRDDWDPSR